MTRAFPFRQARWINGSAHRTRALFGALLAATPTLVGAQASSVRGTAFDSVSMRPLAHALISIAGTSRSVVADERGHFEIDSLSPMRVSARMQHERLDALGLSSVVHDVTPGQESDAVFAIPSYRTLWRRVCGEMVFDTERGVIFGSVGSANRKAPFSHGTVTARWADVRMENRDFREQHWLSEAVVDSSGAYVLCGVPLEKSIRLEATSDARSTDATSIVLERNAPIARRNLRIPVGATLSAGSIVGQVLNADGDPLGNVRVRLAGKPEVRTLDDGTFAFFGVAAGTRRVEALTLGSVPTAAMVDVFANDTAHVLVEMNVVRTLDSVRIVAAALRSYRLREIDFRRQSSGGYFRDSTDVVKHLHLSTMFESIPSVQFSNGHILLPSRPGLAACTANVFLDGALMDDSDLPGEFRQRNPADIAVIEVYPRALSTPGEFVHRDKNQSLCGSVVIWTKRALK